MIIAPQLSGCTLLRVSIIGPCLHFCVSTATSGSEKPRANSFFRLTNNQPPICCQVPADLIEMYHAVQIPELYHI